MTNRMLRILGLAGGLALATRTSPVLGQTVPVDSAKRVAIRQLLAIQHTDSLMLVGIEQGVASQAQTLPPGMPAGFMDSVLARMHRDIGQFVERLVPVYDSLYTAQEITQMIAFYQTPLGQRLLATQLALSASVAAVARQWGMEVAGEVMVDLSHQKP